MAKFSKYTKFQMYFTIGYLSKEVYISISSLFAYLLLCFWRIHIFFSLSLILASN